MFRKLLDQGQAGDNVGVLLRGTKREEVERGQVLAKPGSIAYDYNISVGVAVGFIALAGMAAEIGVLVLSFIDMEVAKRRAATSTALSVEEIKDAVLSATSKRVRPVAMTAISTMGGLLPIMLSSATGSDVTHRIAAPMLGGMLTVMVLNLLVLPVIYSLILQYQEIGK